MKNNAFKILSSMLYLSVLFALIGVVASGGALMHAYFDGEALPYGVSNTWMILSASIVFIVAGRHLNLMAEAHTGWNAANRL